MKIETRPERPYVAIKDTVTMTTFAKIADRLPGLIGWVFANGHEMAGAPFFRYLVIDMAGDIEVEAGVPLAAPADGEGDILAGVLPAGEYAVAMHHGHPDGLADVWESLLAQVNPVMDGSTWSCRLESYLTNPVEEPDPDNWDTEIAVRVHIP